MRSDTSRKLPIVLNDHAAGSWWPSFCFLLLLSLMLFVPLRLSAQTDTFIHSIDRIKKSVIPVLCGAFTIQGQFYSQLTDGTGFFVDDSGHFVTAAHVIADLKQITLQRPIPCTMAIYIPNDGWERNATALNVKWLVFTDCDIDDSLDLAVCKPRDKIPNKIYPVTFDTFQPPDGSPVAFTGFPLGVVEPLTSRGNIAAYRFVDDSDGPKEFIMDKGTWPGASGSPVYSPQGSVMGVILQRGLNEATGIAIARPSSFVLKFLGSKGVTVAQRSDKEKKRPH